MSEQPRERPPSAEDALQQAGAWLNQGLAATDVERRLCERGVPPAEASDIIEQLLMRRLRDRAAPGERRDRISFRRGVFWCVAGAVVFAFGTVLALGDSGFAHPWFWAAGIAALGLGVYHFIQGRG